MEDKVIKPWGTYQKLQEEPGYWIKRIEVNPGQRLSLQYHYHRKEEWFVVKGRGEVIVGNDTINVKVEEFSNLIQQLATQTLNI